MTNSKRLDPSLRKLLGIKSAVIKSEISKEALPAPRIKILCIKSPMVMEAGEA
jgi:hypothetical protein